MAEGEDMLAAALRHGAVPRTVFAVPDPPSRSTACWRVCLPRRSA